MIGWWSRKLIISYSEPIKENETAEYGADQRTWKVVVTPPYNTQIPLDFVLSVYKDLMEAAKR